MRTAPSRLLFSISTALVVLVMTSGGLLDLLGEPSARAMWQQLGYPEYFGSMLSVAKLLGVFALLAPVPARVREWAYAGLTFDVIGAIVSLLAIGKSPLELVIPYVALAAVVTSYVTWRRRAEPRTDRTRAVDVPHAAWA